MQRHWGSKEPAAFEALKRGQLGSEPGGGFALGLPRFWSRGGHGALCPEQLVAAHGIDGVPGWPSAALTLSPAPSSAYTEPYKVCPISAAPKEDLTSDEEQGSSEEEDGAPRDPSLTHKVGSPPPILQQSPERVGVADACPCLEGDSKRGSRHGEAQSSALLGPRGDAGAGAAHACSPSGSGG